MSNFKKKFKFYGGYVWQIFKDSLPSGIMYVCAGAILMMLTLKVNEDGFYFKNGAVAWMAVCIAAGIGYNALMSWANGGQQYEMLASGNVRRSTEAMYGEGYKISRYKENKEYRLWKGFVVGGLIGLVPLITGLVMGANQTAIDARMAEEKIGGLELMGAMLSGWSVLPIYYANAHGSSISYFIICIFALIPIATTAAFYTGGAYARRNKAIRLQQIADKQAEAAANRQKKVNYGALPGTKPKKRK